jgi:DNA-binding transcriptional LysR family regulator
MWRGQNEFLNHGDWKRHKISLLSGCLGPLCRRSASFGLHAGELDGRAPARRFGATYSESSCGERGRGSEPMRDRIAGRGVAIVPTFPARQDFTSGSLVPLFDPLVNERRGDYLAYPDDHASYPPVVLFRDWLLAAFERDD